MQERITAHEAAIKWNISQRRVTILCREGRINGAIKEKNTWTIPANTEKPLDLRIKNGKPKLRKTEKLPLPIGISDYRIASTEYYYVDKTLLIKDFLDERPMVSLFTRPRRFGKTLNMDMLRTFFEKTDEDTSVYFKNKKIWKCGKKYRDYQGKYPVIFITFKDIKCETWEEAFSLICHVIRGEFQRHRELLESTELCDFEKDIVIKFLKGDISKEDATLSLLNLSMLLHKHYGIPPIIIIDEYDTPIQQGYISGYYQKIILFMRSFFSGGLKDNRHLSYGFMTGILRVAKESIFSGLNNLKINSVLDNKYSGYFGFTPEEVKEMAEYYEAEEKYSEICNWYDGYRFGNCDIFNPWSVINYFSNNCIPKAFWQSTGSNDIIREIISDAHRDTYEKLTSLLKGESLIACIDTDVIYPQIKSNPSTIYSFLLMAGYLKITESMVSSSGEEWFRLALPNKEISAVYNKEILQELDAVIPQAAVSSIREAIFSGSQNKLKETIQGLIAHSVSYFDTNGENFYHGFVLGLCALFENYEVTSNRESGDGRYDIQLKPHNKKLPGVIIEIKAENNCTDEGLKALSKQALQQITSKKYCEDMTSSGIETIYKYGVAFCKKKVEISFEQQ